MSNLQKRQQIIQEKRKQTPLHEAVMEICSWRPLAFYKTLAGISKYPNVDTRKLNLLSTKDYLANIDNGSIIFQEINEKPFFEQLHNFFYTIPQAVLQYYGSNNENSDWGDAIWNGGKNVYLSVSAGDGAENILYTFKGETNVRNIISSVNATAGCDTIFESKTIRNSRNIFFSKYIYDSSDIRFSSNLIGCVHCFGCNDLQNKSYCIYNQQLNKESYFFKRDELLKNKSNFDHYKKDNVKSGGIKISDNCSGDGVFKCSDLRDGYEVSQIVTGKNVLYSDGGNDTSDCYDCMDVGCEASHHLYAVYGQGYGDHVYCGAYFVECSFVYYCYFLQNCSFCLGCIGLKNKSYCILNKQYSKEERYEKVDEMLGKMHEDGSLGSFFPATMNPFYFNDTVAYLIDPTFTKEEVTAKGYLRRDEPIKVDIPAGVQTVKVSELSQFEGWSVGTQFFASDHIFASVHNNTSYQFADGKNSIPTDAKWTINDEILKKVIIDEQGNAYRIIPMELEFLRKYELPLPRKHWLDRMKENFRIN